MRYREARRRAMKRPIVHGNGFIQVWVGQGVRLHVWHPDCPRQHTYTGMHDHRFSFRSRIICGRVVNRTWDLVSGFNYEIWTPGVEGQDTWLLYPTGLKCALANGQEGVYSSGDWYEMGIGTVHDGFVHTPCAATLMTMTGREPNHQVRVLCPVGQEPDNDFERDGFDEDWLWDMIEEVLP